MLMFTSVSTEITLDGEKHSMLFTSPRVPGSHFKVETDAATVQRLRVALTQEVESACAAQGHPHGDGPPHDHRPLNR